MAHQHRAPRPGGDVSALLQHVGRASNLLPEQRAALRRLVVVEPHGDEQADEVHRRLHHDALGGAEGVGGVGQKRAEEHVSSHVQPYDPHEPLVKRPRRVLGGGDRGHRDRAETDAGAGDERGLLLRRLRFLHRLLSLLLNVQRLHRARERLPPRRDALRRAFRGDEHSLGHLRVSPHLRLHPRPAALQNVKLVVQIVPRVEHPRQPCSTQNTYPSVSNCLYENQNKLTVLSAPFHGDDGAPHVVNHGPTELRRARRELGRASE